MAYSDYGGQCFRNGERFEDREDYVVTADGAGIVSTGAHAGLAAAMSGQPKAEVDRIMRSEQCHVVIGDWPNMIGLYKQQSLYMFREGTINATLHPPYSGDVPDHTRLEVGFPATGKFPERHLSVVWEHTDNYYQYVRLRVYLPNREHTGGDPDVVWTAFSGYGVGAGLEDAGYGYCTRRCVDRLRELFQ